jgi:hypothetical protein
MEMKALGKVTGFKGWKDPESGIDSGKVYIESNLKNSSKESYGQNKEGFAKGYASQEYNCRDTAVVARIRHLETPFTAELIIENETDGKGNSTQVIIDIKPIQAQKAAA